MKEQLASAVGPVAFLAAGLAALGWHTLPQAAQPPEASAVPAVQRHLESQVPLPVRRQKVPTARPAEHGEALVAMRIPRFGEDWRWTALEGVEDEVIAHGPGHYQYTPLPGEIGNSAFAAHRAGHGDPFIDFDKLRAGDRVLLSQRTVTWVYRLTGPPRLVDADDVHVLDPTPGRTITLTTCWPRWGSSRRLVVHGDLVGVRRGEEWTPSGAPAASPPGRTPSS